MEIFLGIAILITDIALIALVLLQSRGVGLGGLGGGDFGGGGGGYHVRRGVEKLVFNLTIAVSFIFFFLCILIVTISG